MISHDHKWWARLMHGQWPRPLQAYHCSGCHQRKEKDSSKQDKTFNLCDYYPIPWVFSLLGFVVNIKDECHRNDAVVKPSRSRRWSHCGASEAHSCKYTSITFPVLLLDPHQLWWLSRGMQNGHEAWYYASGRGIINVPHRLTGGTIYHTILITQMLICWHCHHGN